MDCSLALNLYRAGNPGGQVEHGESETSLAHPLVQRQSPCGETGDRKHWPTNPRRRWGNLENARREDDSPFHPAPTRISASPLRRVSRPKSTGAQRPLSIPNHARSGETSPCTRLSLDPVAETTADLYSYGFRTACAASDAIEACFIALCRKDRVESI